MQPSPTRVVMRHRGNGAHVSSFLVDRASACRSGTHSRRCLGRQCGRRGALEPPGERHERLLDIRDQVLDAFEANGEPQQIGWAGTAGPLDARPVLDQAFDAAERGRPLPHLHASGAGDGGCLAAPDAHRQHAAEPALHLARGDRVSGMRCEARDRARARRRGDARNARRWPWPRRIDGARARAGSASPAAAARPRTIRGWRPACVRSRAARSKAGPVRANTIAPATTSEWPLRYLVAECSTMSAPSASGRVSTGVGTVESTASSAPAAWAQRAASAMSVMIQIGLDGVSIQTSRVRPGLIAARERARDRPRRRTSPPVRGSAHPRVSHWRRPQYIAVGATTCAGRSSARNAVVAAAMPEANSRLAAPPSSSVRTSSTCRTVALSERP